MMITKQFKTETAHRLKFSFSEGCRNLHGHSYLYEVSIEGPISEKDGMVIDFKRLQPIKDFIMMMDHTTVLWSGEENSIKSFFIDNFNRVLIMRKHPTAENMVRLIGKAVTEWLNQENIVRVSHLQETFPFRYVNLTEEYKQKLLASDTYKLANVRIWETTTGSAQGNEFDKDDVFDFVSESLTKEYSQNISLEKTEEVK